MLNIRLFITLTSQHQVRMSLRKQTPSDFLKQIIGRPVVVKLNSGVDYRGNDAAMPRLTRHTSYMDNKEVRD